MHAALRSWILVVSLSIAALPGSASAKTDPVLKCRNKIVEASGNYLRKTENALQKCRNSVLTGALPADTDCTTEPGTAAAIAGHERALARLIARNCGGDDNTCNTGDDIPLASIGWNVGTCPGAVGTTCTNAITGCADVATCLQCIGRAGIDRVIGLTYETLTPTDGSQKSLRKCQVAIGKAAAKFIGLKSKALGACWSTVNKGKATAPCPVPGDGKAGAAITAAESKLSASVCKACAGADKECFTGDDVTPSAIGFPATCPAVGACGTAVPELRSLVNCVTCVAEHAVDCGDRASVPYLAAYPAACKPASQTLDFSKPPNYGSTSLTSGFVPDPFTVGITSGGSVNVSYLGGGCTGFATSAPDFSVNYTAGAFPTLRFYFVGNGDTAMIVNDPTGTYRCADDSFGTLNPTIDFNSPSSGRYDIWIASFSAGTFVSGTLFVTENTGNHP